MCLFLLAVAALGRAERQVEALILMYLAGWTHRDVSTGNIIVTKHGGLQRGKLSDLEYAREFDNPTQSPDPKTVGFNGSRIVLI